MKRKVYSPAVRADTPAIRRRLERLLKEREALNVRIEEITEFQDRVALQASVGRAWKYHNSAGGGSRWWTYALATGMDDAGWLTSVQFDVRDSGEVTIEKRTHLRPPNGGWTEIAGEELLKAWDVLRIRLDFIQQDMLRSVVPALANKFLVAK